MELEIAMVLKRKNVTYLGKKESVFKVEGLEVGYCNYNYTKFTSLYREYKDEELYIFSTRTRNIVGKPFDKNEYYVKTIDWQKMAKTDIRIEEYNKVTNAYFCLDSDMAFQLIKDENYIKEIEKVFGKVKDNSIINDNKRKKVDSKTKDKLRKYGCFLTDKNYSYDPAIGRDNEIENLELALLHPEQSAMIVGLSGVGKTALVEGLAYKISNGLVPDRLKDIEIVSINISSLLAGTRYRGDFEEKLVDIINILKENKNIVMFIDEIHTVIGAGANSESNLDAANILKPYLDRGDIKIIGSTTKEEYDNLINDLAFKRRFKKVNVDEPERDILSTIVTSVIDGLEKDYNIKFNVGNDLINILLDLTNDKSRDYKDKENNPALVLSIIKDIFSVASLYNHEEVLLEDIIKAINSCDRIYKSTRQRYILELQKKYLINNNKKETKVRVLKFNNNDNLEQ